MKKLVILLVCFCSLLLISKIVCQLYFVEVKNSKWIVSENKSLLFNPKDDVRIGDTLAFIKSKVEIEFRDNEYFVSINDKVNYKGQYKQLNKNKLIIFPLEFESCPFKDTISIIRKINSIKLVSSFEDRFGNPHIILTNNE